MEITGNGSVVRGLGGARGFGEIEIARSDDGSTRLSLEAVFGDGLSYLGRSYAADQLWVNTNGTVTFGSAFAAYPTATNGALSRAMIAPFWADVDTRLDGEGDESGGIWVDVNATGGVVTITWDAVGVYRWGGERFHQRRLRVGPGQRRLWCGRVLSSGHRRPRVGLDPGFQPPAGRFPVLRRGHRDGGAVSGQLCHDAGGRHGADRRGLHHLPPHGPDPVGAGRRGRRAQYQPADRR